MQDADAQQGAIGQRHLDDDGAAPRQAGELVLDHPRRAQLPALHEFGSEALSAMERHLGRLPWFGGERYSIADIALFAYTHDAPAAGIALDEFPHVAAWLERVRAQPGFVPQ